MEIRHEDIFSTRIWVCDFSHLSEHFDTWRTEIIKLRNSDMEPRGKSNRLGWNSQPIISTLPTFKPLMKECEKAFNAVIKVVSPKRDYRYSIEAWANVNDKGGFNTLHSHPGALMSGTFYLTVPEGSGNLVFRDPRLGVVLSSFHGNDAPNASNDKYLVPKVGMLALFPNWLEHRVEPHQGDIPRVSIAMNAQQAIVPV
jgi:uncharacterized protein (TIGR02466 family)